MGSSFARFCASDVLLSSQGGCSFVEVILPIRRDAPLWSRRRLLKGPRSRRRELGTVEWVPGSIAPIPILTRLKARFDKVASLARVNSGVLVWRRILTYVVPAIGAGPQGEQPLASI